MLDRRADRFDLMAGQRGIWYAQQLDPANANFNAGEYLEIHGALDITLFTEAVRRTVAEAQTLHLRFSEGNDGPCQYLEPTAAEPSADDALRIFDLSTEEDPHRHAVKWMRADMGRLRDLGAEPLFSYALFKLGDDRFYWYQGYHHIAIDGFSARMIAARVARIYTALAGASHEEGTPLAPLSVLLDADAAYRASEEFAADRAFWLDTLADRPEPASLSGQRTPGVAREFRREVQEIAPVDAERLRAAAGTLATSLPGLVVAATALFLSHTTGEQDVTVGLPALGRAAGIQHDVPAMMSNVLPVRMTVRPGMTLQELVDQSSVRVWEALRHQRYRYEDIRRDLRLAHGEALYSLSVNIMPFDYKIDFGGLPTAAHNVANGPFDDMSIAVYDRSADGSIQLAFDVDPELYEESAHHENARRFQRILDWVTTTPGQEPVARADALSPEERHRILEVWNDTARPDVRPRTFPDLFEARVGAAPQNPALIAGELVLTYAELNQRANRLAHRLVAFGVGPESLVAVRMRRSPEFVIAALAVMKAGGAYLPVDPDYPAERVRYMLDDAQPMCALIAGGVDAEGLGIPHLTVDEVTLSDGSGGSDTSGTDRDLTDDDRTTPLSPTHPAYVIYTSGSTGRPKGVAVSHVGVASLSVAQV
ncbi:condensation domain-containing protein, partial [Streptomyces sp. NPDC021622]|uniref:condensation domain-containing protein n=1 Tax=Streptomyces sp. NPDC021622 TaxID=3155013 RepID=UPI0033E86B43